MSVNVMLRGRLVSIDSDLKKHQRAVTAETLTGAGSLLDFLSATVVTVGEGQGVDYLPTPELLEDEFQVKRIIARPCYRHMLPIVEANVLKGVCVRGTPGIGKTVFGYFVFRDFIEKGRSVVYWNESQAILFSQNPDHIKLFDLKNPCTINGDTSWRWGAWAPDDKHLGEFLFLEDVFIVHDPAPGFMSGGNHCGTKNMVITISFDHELMSFWNTKRDGRPNLLLTMPVFEYDEIMDNKANLFHGKEMSDKEIKKLYDRFGGSIGYFMHDSRRPWEELRAKILDVATRGCGLTLRTTNYKGTVVHLSTDFDKARPVFPEPGYNTFERTGFVLGSSEITREFSRALASKERDQLRTFMLSIEGQRGEEAVYGVLFEIHAHHILQDSEKELNIRVVRYDGKNKSCYSTTTIPTDGVKEFDGQEAQRITEAVGESKLKLGTYIMPTSSTFPSYDAAMVVPGKVVGLDDHPNVGLLLQMTVSGATSLLRRPEHSVKQYMRKAMHTALGTSVAGFSVENLSVTTFCVPTACFHPFIFQMEERKDSKTLAASQPEFQFVIEIPEFTQLPIAEKPVDEIHGTSGRMHRFMFRQQKAKRMKLEDLHGEEE